MENSTYNDKNLEKNGKIDWLSSADRLEQQINGGTDSYCLWEQANGAFKQIKVLKVRTFKFPNAKAYPVGKTLVVPQNEIGVQCKENFLVIEKLQMEKEEPMLPEEFIRSHSDFIGAILK